jgi:hypothetical protein
MSLNIHKRSLVAGNLVSFIRHPITDTRKSEPQNSRITNHAKDVIYDPNFEGWFRYAQSFL